MAYLAPLGGISLFRSLILTVGNDALWRRFCQAANRPDLEDDARFATNPDRVRHRETLIPILEALFRERSASEWIELLEKAAVPYAPVWNHAQTFASEQADARGPKIVVKDANGAPVNLIGSPWLTSQFEHGYHCRIGSTRVSCRPPRLDNWTCSSSILGRRTCCIRI